MPTIDFKNTAVSVYRGVTDRKGRLCSLADFLSNPDVAAITRLRATPDPRVRKAIKLALPQATVSGLFSPSRSAANLVRHSGFICIDIDGKDNLHLEGFDRLKQEVLARLPYVAYASLSVGGAGYFAIIPLMYPERHKEQFLMLKNEFAYRGIVVDSACSDVCRLRTQSYDPQAYFNPRAEPFALVRNRVCMPHRLLSPRHAFDRSPGSDRQAVAEMCRRIAQRHVDLTASYADWTRVGMSLTPLGEDGRQWFHVCSAQNPKYTPAETDRVYTRLLRATRSVGLGTFFYLCRRAGL